ncbi:MULTISPECIES: hypothetical protein [unclassified Streptomyces]|uniref:hypothetical protein n=1 Tax=unclassified Streptomyces TaxID=2593676 RepID=UPI000DAED37D|nr:MULTISPECIES: hypothetical protein [unclassified Streptomyces]PZT76437.1 hypothetical protein DNK56_24195 [Streptomyces sp. AC1-42W]PZT79606.1 hypothetical protein DNK55_08470 [Streptomyces sp. AC1-42T]
MIDETTPGPAGAPAGPLPPRAQAALAGTPWEGLPHACTGRHGVPDTPDVLGAVLATDPARRVRAVGDLYRLVLHQEQVFPATAPAALVLAGLLDDPRTLSEDRWERRAGRRSLRAELLNWLVSFADLARLDVEDGVGTAQDLAAARAARPLLHDRIADFYDADDPPVREAALAATALLLADPALASHVPRYAPAVREVLAVSADSYYRCIARERLTAWGEDVTGLITAEEERRVALDRAHELAEDPFGGEAQEQAIRWLEEQPEDTAAPQRLGRRREDRTAPEPAPEPPVAAPWRIAREEERAEWTFTPYVGVGPLHFGMTLEEITRALGEEPAVSSYSHHGEDPQLSYADFTASGIRALFRNGRLGCVAADALTGPQVRLAAAPLTGCAPSHVEAWLAHRTTRPGALAYSVADDPIFADLGLAIRSQRAGDIVLTRPLFLLHDWLDLWHALPDEEWNHP